MVSLEVNDAVVLEQKQVLEQALSTNPKTQKALQKLIRKAIMDVRKDAVSAVGRALDSDPRGAAHGIRTAVYKKILGGNMNILNMRRKAGKPTTYEAPRKLQPHQRGGNRVPRGARTNTVMHYGPHDRGWILRIINSGTINGDRTAGTRGGRLSGNRGSITARNFFRGAAEPALQEAVNNLAMMIDTELVNILNKKQ